MGCQHSPFSSLSSQHNESYFNIFAEAGSVSPSVEDPDNQSSDAPIVSSITRKLKLRGSDVSTEEEEEKEESMLKSSLDKKEKLTLNQVLIKAGKRGIGGGIPGAIAGVVQVLSLMWLRTIINYQYRYGVTFAQALHTLFNEGGVRRFYRGLGFALFQAPLARFGSTAANDGVESFFSSLSGTHQWGPGRVTVVASIAVGFWRMALMPIDTCKTVLQVDSAEGFRNLMRKVRGGKIGVLYQGMFANAISAIVSHYPWFYTYNYLSKSHKLKNILKSSILRNAGIGFTASVISDTVSNCIRVVKTTKQAIASKHVVGYGEAIQMVLAADGWKGLFGRGLKTRIFANGAQSVIFTVIWRGLATHGKEEPNISEPKKKSASDVDHHEDEEFSDEHDH